MIPNLPGKQQYRGPILATCIGIRGPMAFKPSTWSKHGPMKLLIDFAPDVNPSDTITGYYNWPWALNENDQRTWPCDAEGKPKQFTPDEISAYSRPLKRLPFAANGQQTLFGVTETLGGIIDNPADGTFKTDFQKIVNRRCKLDMQPGNKPGSTFIGRVFIDEESLKTPAPARPAPAPAPSPNSGLPPEMVEYAQAVFKALRGSVDEAALRKCVFDQGAPKFAAIGTVQQAQMALMDFVELASKANKVELVPELPRQDGWAEPLVSFWAALKQPDVPEEV